MNALFAVRLAIATGLAALAATGTAVIDGKVSLAEGVAIATATLGAAGTYFGLGTKTSVEPDAGQGPDDDHEDSPSEVEGL